MKGKFVLSLALLLMTVGLSLVSLALCSSQYDVNGDGVVDILDIEIWGLSFGTFEGEEDFNSNVDINQDGVIDIFDAVLISLHFGEQDS
ncbi:MAG: dockerin type I domain-containing protein [Candidatus Heimdallarchaeaceae archaeon]